MLRIVIMTTIFSYKKNSYNLTKDEKDILLMFLNFFKYEIPDGNGSYIAMLDLDKIDFTWSPAMALNDQGVFGSWIFTFKDEVFLRPAEDSAEFVKRLLSMNLSKNEREFADNIIASKNYTFVQFRNLRLNQELLKFAMYLCENEGTMLSTIFHELYHKWQFNTSKMLYIINFFVFLFTGYEFSTKSKFSIEGDVRIYVDNDELHRKLSKFYNVFYSFMYIHNQLAVEKSDERKEMLISQLNDLETTENRFYVFCEKLLEKLKE